MTRSFSRFGAYDIHVVVLHTGSGSPVIVISEEFVWNCWKTLHRRRLMGGHITTSSLTDAYERKLVNLHDMAGQKTLARKGTWCRKPQRLRSWGFCDDRDVSIFPQSLSRCISAAGSRGSCVGPSGLVSAVLNTSKTYAQPVGIQRQGRTGAFFLGRASSLTVLTAPAGT
ncbi:hypothetical protein M011DRAFT_467242 [Sporormia fimetaria CBS 119925]|uniref:Uncharacterized protein n=1 Tax=Sporormia fimetaria CBS 119925 TaxID=1340428 RepID=A0A6A6VEJ0_9PLEO|nr:hypothetical protein M011DRAFT_467242 [Sporormia fimetaria CBS 119925]